MRTTTLKTRNPLSEKDLVVIPIVSSSFGLGVYYATSLAMNRGKAKDAPDRKVAVPIIAGVSAAFTTLAAILWVKKEDL